MKIEHNSHQLMDNLKIDKIQFYGAPSNTTDVYIILLCYILGLCVYED